MMDLALWVIGGMAVVVVLALVFSRPHEHARFYLEVAGFILAVLYAGINVGMWRAQLAANELNSRAFEATQRAALVLGLPDGVMARFLDSNAGGVAIYFRNDGRSTAKDAVVESWEVLTPPAATVYISAFNETLKPGALRRVQPGAVFDAGTGKLIGPDVPGGSILTHYSPLAYGDRIAVATGKKNFTIVGRASFDDNGGGKSCEAFCVTYWPVTERFQLCAASGAPLCDGKEHELGFGEQVIGPTPSALTSMRPTPVPQTTPARSVGLNSAPSHSQMAGPHGEE